MWHPRYILTRPLLVLRSFHKEPFSNRGKTPLAGRCGRNALRSGKPADTLSASSRALT
jgi:hypothetical protein